MCVLVSYPHAYRKGLAMSWISGHDPHTYAVYLESLYRCSPIQAELAYPMNMQRLLANKPMGSWYNSLGNGHGYSQLATIYILATSKGHISTGMPCDSAHL